MINALRGYGCHFLATLLILFGSSGDAYAQTGDPGNSADSTVYTVSISELDQSDVSLEQANFLNRFTTDSFYEGGKVVRIDTILNLLSEDSLVFSLPDSETTYKAVNVSHGHSKSPYYDEIWMGNISDGGVGNVLLLRKDQLLAGFIQVQEGFFSIFPSENGSAFLLKHDVEEYDRLTCGNMDSSAVVNSPIAVDPCMDPPSTCPALIDVLVLMSDEARLWLDAPGDPWGAFLYTMIGLESVNLALINSGVSNKQFRFTIERFDFDFDPANDFRIDLNNLSSSSDIQELRDGTGADLVVLLSDDRYTAIAGIAEGIGPSVNTVHAITAIPFMINPRWTFAHEVGRLLGARHNRIANGGNDNTDVCSHGWQFAGGTLGVKRTILALAPATTVPPGTPVLNMVPGGRLLNFSNPDVIVDGGASGTIDDDNARTIANTACEVAQFRPDPTFRIQLSMPDEVCMQDILLARVLIFEPSQLSPGQPPYTITWNVSASTAETILVPIQVSYPQQLVVTVTVTSSDGETLTESQTVDIVNCQEPHNPFALGEEKSQIGRVRSQNELKEAVKVFPNPTSGILTIGLPVVDEQVQIEIIDINGRSVFPAFLAIDNRTEINLGDLANGLYFVRVVGASFQSMQSFIKM